MRRRYFLPALLLLVGLLLPALLAPPAAGRQCNPPPNLL